MRETLHWCIMKVLYSRKTAVKLNVSKYSPVLHTWTEQFIVQVDKLAEAI